MGDTKPRVNLRECESCVFVPFSSLLRGQRFDKLDGSSMQYEKSSVSGYAEKVSVAHILAGTHLVPFDEQEFVALEVKEHIEEPHAR